jgi:hypothetical protein
VSAVTPFFPSDWYQPRQEGATGGWSGSGETGAEMMVLDTTTNEVIAMGWTSAQRL